MTLWRILKKFIKFYVKPWRSAFPVMLQTFLTQRALEGHSKSTWVFKVLGHSSTLRRLGTWMTLRYSGTRALEHTQTHGHSGTWRTLCHSDTKTLWHLGYSTSSTACRNIVFLHDKLLNHQLSIILIEYFPTLRLYINSYYKTKNLSERDLDSFSLISHQTNLNKKFDNSYIKTTVWTLLPVRTVCPKIIFISQQSIFVLSISHIPYT